MKPKQFPPPPPDDAPWLATFIPLPSNPADLTLDDVRAAFTGDWLALRDLMQVAKEVARRADAEPMA